MVKIRLAQEGSANRKTYRIVAIEEGKRRDGRALEILGSVNPLVKPAKVVIKRDRVEFWLSRGAQMTPAVQTLIPDLSK